MTTPHPPRIRPNWPNIRAALVVCFVSITLPLTFLTIAAERINP